MTMIKLPAFDKRRQTIQTLQACLRSRNPKLREAAIYKVMLRLFNEPYIHIAGRLAMDKSQPEPVRICSIQLLGQRDKRVIQYLRRIADNEHDDICRRSDALEQLVNHIKDRNLDYYIQFLSDPLPDLRFWACYCLASQAVNPTPALTLLDALVANDHTVPECFGWHVDREALHAYEHIYFHAPGTKPPPLGG